MKLTLIQPSIGRRNGEKFKRPWTLEPLNIITLAGLTPKDVELEFFDDRLEDMNYDTDPDLVGISVETYTALRAYQIASEFKKRGKKVILGGVHPTLMPKEAKQHADSVFMGQAEGKWEEVLEDFKRGNLKEFYNGKESDINDIKVDRGVLGEKRYIPVKLIEFGRGCPYSCDFCDIPLHFDGKYSTRRLDLFRDELEKTKGKKFLFVDDNINSNPKTLESLCDGLIGKEITWYSQATSRIGRDERLLDKLAESGCGGVLIGFESLSSDNLKARNKSHNKVQDYETTIKNLHDRNIQIYGSFIVGNEQDTRKSVMKMVDFALDSGLLIANFNPLTPIPMTPFYSRLKEEGKLVRDPWWLDPNHRYGDFVFNPGNMSREEAEEVCLEAKQRFYSLRGIMQRLPLERPKNIPMHLIVNALTRKEVFQKDELYLGLKGEMK